MQITKLGEFGLIERFKRRIHLDSTVIQGPGDDCAVVKYNKDTYLLFTCDMLVEGVDFIHQQNPYLIGRKSIAVAISDIAACGGWPVYCLISFGLPANTSIKFVDRFSRGLRDVAKDFQVNIVGGDISRSTKLVVDVSMLGKVEKKNLVLRKGAKKGDIIFVTGGLGGSIRGRHLKFTPRVKEARFLVNHFDVHAMLDISDGLIQDLGHILKASNVGGCLYANLIPLSKEARGLDEALYMGEDFELLFTLAQREARQLIQKTPRLFRGAGFTPIGEILDRSYGLQLIDAQGRSKRIEQKGYRHF
jgi:thiamine-monophosphate kinase